MHLGRPLKSLVFMALLTLASSCSKSGDGNSTKPASPTPLAPGTVLRVHWAGKQKLGVSASAYSFMRLWEQPNGRTMQAQFMERLASAPWRLITNRPPAVTAPIPEVKAMIYDIINEETFLEIRRNGTDEQLAFAIRLDTSRAGPWSQHLASVISSLEGNFPSRQAAGWTSRGKSSGKQFDAQIVGPWLLFGIAKNANSLLQEIKGRIEKESAPFTITTNAHWLAVDADLRWVAEQTGLAPEPTADLPRVSLLMDGNGAYAETRGELVFANALGLKLEPWSFPKDQLQGAIASFSAVRGVGPWLPTTRAWSDLKLGAAPNQIFTWADARAPLQMHLAAPSENASEITKGLLENFAPRANAWLNEHALGSVAPWPNSSSVVWKDLPMIAPYLTATNSGWLIGGTSPSPLPDAKPLTVYQRPSLDELLTDIQSRTNLVAYHWEATGSRAESTHVLGQLLRAITRHPQMPANTPSSQWLESARDRLANSTTTVTLTKPNTLSFERRSTTGFTALELHAIADWMESPQFPRGFYSTLSPVGPPLQPAGKQ